MKTSKKKTTPAVTRPKTTAKAAQRKAQGKFTMVIFNPIGGKECRRFAAMTWKERDAFMAKPENAVVQERYEKHLASVTSCIFLPTSSSLFQPNILTVAGFT